MYLNQFIHLIANDISKVCKEPFEVNFNLSLCNPAEIDTNYDNIPHVVLSDDMDTNVEYPRIQFTLCFNPNDFKDDLSDLK